MAKLILGITGEMGSGKGTVAKHLTLKHNSGTHRFSTILRDILDRLYLEQSRSNMSVLSTILRETFGEDLMAKGIYHDTQKDTHDIVAVDGVRRMSDITYLRQVPCFKLVYLETDMRTRWERITKRGENADDAKKTFEEFQKDHENESELQIKDLRNYADYVVNNDGAFEDLYKQVDEIVKKFI